MEAIRDGFIGRRRRGVVVMSLLDKDVGAGTSDMAYTRGKVEFGPRVESGVYYNGSLIQNTIQRLVDRIGLRLLQ